MIAPDNGARRRISIFDATLRDGEQAPGNGMTPEQKVKLALEFEAYGADIVEAGFPGSSPTDHIATRMIAQALTTARFATFNRCSRDDVRLSMEAAGDAPNHQIQICGTGSDLHLEHKRGITRDEAVWEVGDALGYAAELGATDISFGIEDASRGDLDLIHRLVDAALEAGAKTIILADTTGYATPQEFGDLNARVRSWIEPEIVLSAHCHDDLGLSLANALAAIEAGANEVQSTLGGIGERAGNTALEELVAVLACKGDRMGLSTAVRTESLYAAYRTLAETIALPTPRNKAVFGTNAFATQAGIHQAGILRNPATYEFIDPYRFGRKRSLVIGRHSGRAILRLLLEQLDVPADAELVDALYEEHIASRPDSECDELDVMRARLAAQLTGCVPAGRGW